MNKEIEIPEGYEARIEGNKVIIEPKESEDERVRKEIIDYFYRCIKRNSKSGFRVEQIKGWIAYLEKQKDSKEVDFDTKFDTREPRDNWEYIKEFCDKFGRIPKDMDELDVLVSYVMDKKQKEQKPSTEETELNSIAFLEQMGYTCIPPKEQKSNIELIQRSRPAEWSKEYLEEGLRTRFAIYTYKNEDGVLYLSNVFVEEASRNKGFGTKILQATEKVAETIGAITIRLKVKRNSPANDWYRKRGYKYLTVEGEYDWLEKNLEYMKPSKPAEWSEEDERILYNVKAYVGFAAGQRGVRDDAFKEANNWLKSLPERFSLQPAEWSEEDEYCRNQLIVFCENCMQQDSAAIRCANWLKSLCPSWKPSELQMFALDSAILMFHNLKRGGDKKELESLYNDLKKL